MAEEEKDAGGETEESPIELLQAKSKGQLTLLFAACGSSLVFLIILGFAYVTLSTQIVSATSEPLMEMKNLSGLISDEYSNLNMAVEFYNHQMDSIADRLDQIDPAVDQAKFDELKQVLISQERDFQIFLNSTQQALFGLSEMVSGSRSWRDDLKSKLDLAITTSEARELSLEQTDDLKMDKAAEESMAEPINQTSAP